MLQYVYFLVERLNLKNRLKARTLNDSIYQNMINALQNIDWDFLNVMSTEESFSKFQEILTDALDQYVSMKDIKISHTHNKTQAMDNYWLLKSSQTLDRLYRLKLNKPKTDIKYVNYIKYKNYYNKLKRIAKRQYVKDKLNLYKNDIRKTWKTLNNIIGRMNDKSSISDILVIDGQQTRETNVYAS